MADDLVNIEIDGVPVKVRKGEMIIRATDAHGVYVPRFCYHDKLSIAANCRMCLVEVEKAPKPLPACATPVAEGMKVFTQSPRAIGAQRATMEFLLINHPLDCPICDQGGECELQDLAVGFGRDASRFTERKRVVPDENLGPLIATDMTRCIHCTRCIRFTEEIAGIQELGMIGRGEHMKVRTYIESTVNHELSGNVIDLCPVGALVSKPYRFSARAWEMTATPLISPHDPVGTNLYGHVLRGRLMRVLPRENEAINEVWIADRDRFSYEGVYSHDRLEHPLVRRDGDWVATDWESALARGRGRPQGACRRPRRAGERVEHASRSCISPRASRADSAPTTSIIACASAISAIRAPTRHSPGLGMRYCRGRCARCAARHRLEPAPRGADARAPRAQGRAARRAGRAVESGALPVPVPGEGVPHLGPRGHGGGSRGRRGRGERRAGQAVPAPLVAAVSAARVTDAHRALAQTLSAGAKACDLAGRTRRAPPGVRGPAGARRGARPRSPAPRSAGSPKAATPPAPISRARSRTARRAHARWRSPG